jgi:hypothetical protein
MGIGRQVLFKLVKQSASRQPGFSSLKKGLQGPFSLEINYLAVKNVDVPFIEFFPFLYCQALSFAPTLCHRGWAQFHM